MEQLAHMNNGSMYDYVDPYAKSKREHTVQDSMGSYMPHPPSQKPEKQGPGQDISDCVGEHQRGRDIIREGRLQYR